MSARRRTTGRPDEEDRAHELEPVWRALASGTRRRMLDLLRDGPRSTGELAERFPTLSRFAVMQHLGVLVEADLVIARREGRVRLNYLNPVPIRRIFERWVSRYQEHWTDALVSLKSQMEREPDARRPRTG